MAIQKIQEGDQLFVGGMNSSLDDTSLSPTQYSRAMNMVNRGGVLQCRPGYRCVLALPKGRLQGFFVFRPKIGAPILVFGVAGLVYTSQFPFKSFSQMAGVQFSDAARQLYFCQAEQSLQLNADSSLELISPRNVLVIQDGARTAPVLFDGTKGEHQRGSGKIPLGGPMAASGDRLWVARDTRVFASDIANPTAFTESQYITGSDSFIFKHEVTALSPVPGVDQPQLLVFTSQSTSLLQSGVRDRTQWSSTQDFQRELFSTIGCLSQRSVASHMGYLWWFSQFGLVSFDSATQGHISSALPYLDEQMSDSKYKLSPDLSGVAAVTFENYLLLSVPYGEKLNRHTWVLDNSTLASAEKEAAVWNSVWTGTRPVEWFSGDLMGRQRVLYVSADFDGNNRLWEAFTPDRLDEGCPITWWAELRGYSGGSPNKFKEFRYADIFFTQLSGDVDLAVFWAGADRGKYKRILTKRVRAASGLIRSGHKIKMSDRLFALKSQSRYLRTQDVRGNLQDETLSSCDIEAPYAENKDDAFQLLVVGSGVGGIRGTVLYMDNPDKLDDSGKCETDEVEESFVRFDGAAVAADTVEDAQSAFSAAEASSPTQFYANRTVTLTQDGVTEIGIGEHTSVISQADAEKVADTIAARIAATRLQGELPKRVARGGK